MDSPFNLFATCFTPGIWEDRDRFKFVSWRPLAGYSRLSERMVRKLAYPNKPSYLVKACQAAFVGFFESLFAHFYTNCSPR